MTPQAPSSPAPVDLGPAVYTNRFKQGQAAALAWFGIVVGPLMGAGLIAGAILVAENWGQRVLTGAGGIAFLVFSPMQYFHQRRARAWHLTVYRDGLEVLHGRQHARFRLEDIENFGFSAVRLHVNGADAGLRYDLTFVLGKGSRQKVVHWSSIDDNPQEGLDEIRGWVAAALAPRLLREFDALREVRWTDALKLRKDGIAYRPMGWWGRSAGYQFVSFGDIDRTELKAGEFHVYGRGQQQPLFTCQQSELGFFPGLLVYDALMSSRCGAT